MDLIMFFYDFIMHLDKHLAVIVSDYGTWTYVILFTIIFCETGLVVAPILPGDSLLFAAGAIASLGTLNSKMLFILLVIAAIAGDTVNYWVGKIMGPSVFKRENSRIFKKEYLDKTHNFYEKYGAKTIILARFVPIVRTFAPFVAGIGSMTYSRFLTYNVVGGIAWITLFFWGGFYFGNIPVIKNNFTVVIIAIIILSIMPGVIEYLRHKYGNKSAEPEVEITD